MATPLPSATAPGNGNAPPAAHGMTIALMQANSLPMLVQQELERMILTGELASGGKLNEASIADRLGVSRGPVREAFRALEESGLVRLEKNRGVFVREIAVEEADEIYELRAVLDEFAGRTLAQRATPVQLAELRALVERMGPAADARDVDLYYRLNFEFHDRLVAVRRTLPSCCETISLWLVKVLSLFRRASLAQGGILPLSTREHRGIVEHIAKGDAGRAGEGPCAPTPWRVASACTPQVRLRRRIIPHPVAIPLSAPRRQSREAKGAASHCRRIESATSLESSWNIFRAPRQRPRLSLARMLPSSLVCVDGCEPDYINQAIEAGVAPFLAKPRCARHVLHRRLRGTVLHQSEQPFHRHRHAAIGAWHLR